MVFHIITLFPNAFTSYLGESIIKRAIEDKKIRVKFYNPRDFTRSNRATPSGSDALGAKRGFRAGAIRIDKKPYGGGPGMVIQAEPVIKAIETAYSNVLKNTRIRGPKKLKAISYKLTAPIIWLSPSGKQFTNESGIKLAKYSDIIIICGRYEGIDARVKQAVTRCESTNKTRMPRIKLEEISVGPYVLTGGELPAMIMIDVIARQVEGVLGDPRSREEARVASPDVYTRPEVFSRNGKKYRVPKVLLTGHHARIVEWRQKQREGKIERVSHE